MLEKSASMFFFFKKKNRKLKFTSNYNLMIALKLHDCNESGKRGLVYVLKIWTVLKQLLYDLCMSWLVVLVGVPIALQSLGP